MGGIVSIHREKIRRIEQPEPEMSSYYSCNSSGSQKGPSRRIQEMDVRRLSFPLQNQISKHEVEPIHENEPETSLRDHEEENHDTFENDGTYDYSQQVERTGIINDRLERIRQLEKQLLRDYNKWDIEKLENHDSSACMFQLYNHQCQTCHF